MIAGCSLHNNNLLCKFLCWLRFNPLGLNLVILLTLILTFVMVDYYNCVSDRRTNRIQKWSLRIHSRYVHFVCENSKNPFLSKSSSQNLEVVVWTIDNCHWDVPWIYIFYMDNEICEYVFEFKEPHCNPKMIVN